MRDCNPQSDECPCFTFEHYLSDEQIYQEISKRHFPILTRLGTGQCLGGLKQDREGRAV